MNEVGDVWWFGVGEFVAAAVGVPGGLAVEFDGELVEIGAVGEESITLPNPNGMTILADLDGDGVVDHVTMHNYAGSYEVWARGASVADWGLPGPVSGNPPPHWGLESDVAPVRGREVIIESRMGGGWSRIEKG